MIEQFRRNRKPIVILLLVLVVLALVWSFYREWDAIKTFPWKFQPVYLLLAFTAYSSQLFLMFVAWHRMVRATAGEADIRLDASVYFISAAARRIPTPVWYLGSRFSLYPPGTIPAAVILVCSVLEVALLALAGILFLFISMPFYSALPGAYGAAVIIPGLILMALLAWNPDLMVQIINLPLSWLGKKKIEVRIQRSHLIEWMGIYLAVYLFNALALYGMILGIMDIQPGFGSMMAIGTIYMLLAYVSMFLTAGFGLKELATGFLFTRWMPFSVGVVITLLYRVLMTTVELIFVVVVKVLLPDKTLRQTQASPQKVQPPS